MTAIPHKQIVQSMDGSNRNMQRIGLRLRRNAAVFDQSGCECLRRVVNQQRRYVIQFLEAFSGCFLITGARLRQAPARDV